MSSPHEDEASQRLRYETMIADCMKKKGFQYIVAPVTVDTSVAGGYTNSESLLKSDAEVRAFRQKYGFGIYSSRVYSDDPKVKVANNDPAGNPNNKIRDALDPARRQAYDEAFGTDGKTGKKISGCGDEAAMAVFGSSDSSPQKQAAAKREYEKFRIDPAVIAAAQKYADCLRGKGYNVDAAEPGSVEFQMFDLITSTLPGDGVSAVSVAKAKAMLPKEIAAALADVDCRGDYAQLVRTKYPKAVNQGAAG